MCTTSYRFITSVWFHLKIPVYWKGVWDCLLMILESLFSRVRELNTLEVIVVCAWQLDRRQWIEFDSQAIVAFVSILVDVRKYGTWKLRQWLYTPCYGWREKSSPFPLRHCWRIKWKFSELPAVIDEMFPLQGLVARETGIQWNYNIPNGLR